MFNRNAARALDNAVPFTRNPDDEPNQDPPLGYAGDDLPNPPNAGFNFANLHYQPNIYADFVGNIAHVDRFPLFMVTMTNVLVLDLLSDLELVETTPTVTVMINVGNLPRVVILLSIWFMTSLALLRLNVNASALIYQIYACFTV
jgi:hypothetical protein